MSLYLENEISTAPQGDAHARAQAIGPLLNQERIQLLDVLRGCAVFGILFVNILIYSAPVSYMHGDGWHSISDRLARGLVVFFVEGKFYSLFSFLFGLGLAVQMSRAEARGTRFVPLYLRRLTVLFVIGVLHAYLLWWGDILHIYAMLGVWLLFFRKRALKTILIWAGICLTIPILLIIVSSIANIRSMNPAVAQEARNTAAMRQTRREAETKENIRVHSEGSYSEIMRQRVKQLMFTYSRMGQYAPHIFALFLLGLYAGRRAIFSHVQENLSFIRQVMWGGLIVGLFGNLMFALKFEVGIVRAIAPLKLLADILYFISAPALCFFYAGAITLLFQRRGWQERLAPLGAVGRMALSNYLLQTVIGTMLFYSYGLGLYGKVGPALCLALSTIIFLIQIPLSVWWLERFQFGPVEWLWRSLTYLKLQPFLVRRDFDLLPAKSVNS